MTHLSLSFASAKVTGDGRITEQLKFPQHGYPDTTAWYFKKGVVQIPIRYKPKGFTGIRLSFHRTEVEYINQQSQGAFLELCADGRDDCFVQLVNKQEAITALQALISKLPERIDNWFFLWKLEVLVGYCISALAKHRSQAILLVSHG